MTGIGLLEHFGSDDFTAQLVGIASDSSSLAWQNAVYALALNRTDEGLKTLKSLLDSLRSENSPSDGEGHSHGLHLARRFPRKAIAAGRF